MKISFYSGTEEILKELGARIKQERIKMNITQDRMAEVTNLSRRTISNLENGADVSLSTLIEVLRLLGHLDGFDLLVPEASIRPSDIAYQIKPRKRASSFVAESIGDNEWKWGDEE